MNRRTFVQAGLATLATGLAGGVAVSACSEKDSTEPGSTNEVQLRDFFFQPATLTVQRGATVRFRKTTNTFHTVTPQGHSAWQRWTTDLGQSFEVTFNTAGTFNYICEPHESTGMVGRIIVQ